MWWGCVDPVHETNGWMSLTEVVKSGRRSGFWRTGTVAMTGCMQKRERRMAFSIRVDLKNTDSMSM